MNTRYIRQTLTAPTTRSLSSHPRILLALSMVCLHIRSHASGSLIGRFIKRVQSFFQSLKQLTLIISLGNLQKCEYLYVIA